MKVEGEISLILKGEAVARTITNSITPDNIGFPKGLSLEASSEGRGLRIRFSSTVDVGTLISTILEVLSQCQLAIDTLQAVQPRG